MTAKVRNPIVDEPVVGGPCYQQLADSLSTPLRPMEKSMFVDFLLIFGYSVSVKVVFLLSADLNGNKYHVFGLRADGGQVVITNYSTLSCNAGSLTDLPVGNTLVSCIQEFLNGAQ